MSSVLTLTLLTLAALSSTLAQCSAPDVNRDVTCTYANPDSAQTFTVPVGVTSLTFSVIGGNGAAIANAGKGGKPVAIAAHATVTPGQTFNIYVGQDATDVNADGNRQPRGLSAVGFGGGPAGGGTNTYGGAGGAASVIQTGGNDFIVAAGGGGASSNANGGNGVKIGGTGDFISGNRGGAGTGGSKFGGGGGGGGENGGAGGPFNGAGHGGASFADGSVTVTSQQLGGEPAIVVSYQNPPTPSGNGRRVKKRHSEIVFDPFACRAPLTSCPITNRATSGSECIDTQTELTSCGGCMFGANSTGEDCTALTNVADVTCQQGACVALSCASGFTLTEGQCL